MKYIMSAMLLAGAAFAAVSVSAAPAVTTTLQNPEAAAQQKRIDALKARHGALKPTTPEQKTAHADFFKRFDAHVADILKADKIAAEDARKKEVARIGIEIDKTEKDFGAFEAGFKTAMHKHVRHDAFLARLQDLRKRHSALKPMKPEDTAKHADFLKRFDAHEQDLAKADKIANKDDRHKEYDRIDKAIAGTEKDFGDFEKHVHGA
jgi:hypothetical protein